MKKLKTLIIIYSLSVVICFAQETWTPTSIINAPGVRYSHVAVGTGNKMIVWGGYSGSGYYVSSGGIYDPVLDNWIPTTTNNTPAARMFSTAVWTGNKMIVWGGYNNIPPYNLNTGGIYDPIANSWTATTLVNAPSVRVGHTAIWTGNKMIVWGGDDPYELNTGGVFDPVSNSWTATAITNAPTGRRRHTAVWSGSKMIIWGGSGSSSSLNTGGIYDPVSNSWSPTSTLNAPSARTGHTAVWTGSKMIVWGGYGGLNTGGIYDPINNNWTTITTNNAPIGRYNHFALWTGNRMIIWGGAKQGQQYEFIFNSGSIYDPITDNWASIDSNNSFGTRIWYTSIWTNNSMIIWGGNSGGYGTNTGAIYNNSILNGIIKIDQKIPKTFSLYQNYPNPFNPITHLRFEIPELRFVKLVIFDLLGGEVATLLNEQLKPGTYEVEWDGSNSSSGIYFYKLISGNYVESRKMVLIR